MGRDICVAAIVSWIRCNGIINRMCSLIFATPNDNVTPFMNFDL